MFNFPTFYTADVLLQSTVWPILGRGIDTLPFNDVYVTIFILCIIGLICMTVDSLINYIVTFRNNMGRFLVCGHSHVRKNTTLHSFTFLNNPLHPYSNYLCVLFLCLPMICSCGSLNKPCSALLLLLSPSPLCPVTTQARRQSLVT